ncbi:MAG: hypothetical protein R3C28_05885 [Pirellulaceae bacterium]
MSSTSSTYKSRDEELTAKFDALKAHGRSVVGGADSRFLVLELYAAITECLPKEEGKTPEEISELPYEERPQLNIQYIESEFFPGIDEYLTPDVKERYKDFRKFLAYNQSLAAGGNPTPPPAADAAEGEENLDEEPIDGAAADGGEAGSEFESPELSGPGWVIEIRGFHLHNRTVENGKEQYVINTLLKNLEQGFIELPPAPGLPPVKFSMQEMGIYYPILANEGSSPTYMVPNPDYEPPAGAQFNTGGRPGEGEGNFGGNNFNTTGDPKNSPTIGVPGYEFTVQFVWIPRTASERMELRAVQEQSATADDNSVANAGGF